MNTKLTIAALLTAGMAMAQVVIPEGTKIRVRLEQNLSSETAELGEIVDFAVVQEVRVGDAIVIANGARVTGSIVLAEPRRRMGRAGKLDFTIERVQLVDGNWLDVRYTPQKNQGRGNGAASGVLTAGLAVLFLPAAPIGLLMKGHDVSIIKGRHYEVFADSSTYVASAAAASAPLVTRVLPQSPDLLLRDANGAPASNGGLPRGVHAAANPVVVSNTSVLSSAAPAAAAVVATLSVNCNQPGADIEIDGMFVGNAPTSLQVAAGTHQVVVKQGTSVWQRNLTVTSGTVTLNATVGARAAAPRAAVK